MGTVTVMQPGQTAIASNAQIPAMNETSRWSVIPPSQRATTLAALTASCHPYSTLAKNKYKSGLGHAKPVGVKGTPSLLPSPTPTHNPQALKRAAVALDCEMVGVVRGKSEVARISAIDVLTGEVLIDTLVQPTQKVTAWRTKYSGITKKAMTTAVAENCVLKGWPEACAELWKYIDSNTILVGHALNHDLDELRMQHGRVVDSAIVAKDAVGSGINRQWGLKALCDQFLGIAIQNHGKQGHDSVEDACAAREVVLWCLAHPEKLAVWGRKAREEEARKKQAQVAKRAEKLRQQQQKLGLRLSQNCRTYDEEDEEVLNWSDIAEALG